jgi:hypothetical protein
VSSVLFCASLHRFKHWNCLILHPTNLTSLSLSIFIERPDSSWILVQYSLCSLPLYCESSLQQSLHNMSVLTLIIFTLRWNFRRSCLVFEFRLLIIFLAFYQTYLHNLPRFFFYKSCSCTSGVQYIQCLLCQLCYIEVVCSLRHTNIVGYRPKFSTNQGIYSERRISIILTVGSA